MFGVYIHIPFCRKACTYCNFHFSTNLRNTDEMIRAISGEIELTALPPQGIKTLYFGGGTPSLLAPSVLKILFEALKEKTDFSGITEITLECNPEDISIESLKNWKDLGVSRLSLGLQSLNNAELQAMNRAHTAEQSLKSLALIGEFGGFEVSVDLIYGTPWKTDQEWQQELEFILNLDHVQHLSAYALSIESKTQLAFQIKAGTVLAGKDERMITQFEILQHEIHQRGWEAYEISNYCRQQHRAVHNSHYWTFVPYYGFGPSAHSFDGHQQRYYNHANNARYLSEINAGQLPRIEERLSDADCLNERLMTGLRTIDGVEIAHLHRFHGEWERENRQQILHFIEQGLIYKVGDALQLSATGKLISDRIISDLMWVE
jgi:oxygen-independent coproporphyrinogen-3 oxidase